MGNDKNARQPPDPESGALPNHHAGEGSSLPADSGITGLLPFTDCQHLLAAALLDTPSSIVLTDPNGVISWVNPAFTRCTGYSAREAIGNTPRILRSGAHNQRFYEHLWGTILDGRIWQGGIANRRKDGTLYNEEMTIIPVRDGNGMTVHFLAIKQDVTVRTQYAERLRLYTLEMARARFKNEQHARKLAAALDELRKSEATFRLLFDAIPQAVYVYDHKTLQFLEVNESTIKRYGYSRQELLGMKISEIRPPEEVPRLMQLLQSQESIDLLTSGWKHMAKDGRVFDVEISARSLSFAGTRAVLVIAQDVTERNRLEVELRHGQKLQAVGGLAAGIAHEINTPIQFVGDNIRFLKDEFSGVHDLLKTYKALEIAAASGAVSPEHLQQAREAYQACDMDYLLEEVPKALSQALDGTARVAAIVRAMKAFSHPITLNRFPPISTAASKPL